VWQGGFDSINRDAGDPWRGQADTIQGELVGKVKQLEIPPVGWLVGWF